VTYKDVNSDWNLDLFNLLIITTDCNHLEQFFQEPAPTVHWQLNLISSEANWTDSSSWSNSNGWTGWALGSRTPLDLIDL
jgi:hypothetical protein